MTGVLVLVAHPDLERSRANRRLVDAAAGLAGVTVHDLTAAYGDGPMDVGAEQARVETHDVLVFQHPLHWYRAPPVLQRWQDEVLTLGWAYGLEGSADTALSGRSLANAVSTGAPADEFSGEGRNGHTLREFLLPYEATATFCGMHYLEPFLAAGTFGADDAMLDGHAERYVEWLTALGG